MLIRRLPWMAISPVAALPFRFDVCIPKQLIFSHSHSLSFHPRNVAVFSFCSSPSSNSGVCTQLTDNVPQQSEKPRNLKPGLYLVGTPIGNLEDISFRAIRVLNSAHVILSEDTRHSGKLLHHYNIKTPLMSYHKFNESQREQVVLKRLKEGEIVALITDAGTPAISDPGMELAKLCVSENIPVVPIPGPCALVSALSASGLPTDEFTFVGFLPKHSGSRRKRLMVSADQTTTQIFYVPPHKLSQFLEESFSIFGDARRCVIAREMTKVHEEASLVFIPQKVTAVCLTPAFEITTFVRDVGFNLEAHCVISLRGARIKMCDECFWLLDHITRKLNFWRGTLSEAKEVFSMCQPKGELTILIEGQANSKVEPPSDIQLENDLRELIASGESLSTAVKLIAGRTSVSRKTIYSLALSKFGKQLEVEDDSN